MAYKMIECNKICLLISGIFFVLFAIEIIINNGFVYKGIYISGVQAYLIGSIEMLLGIFLLMIGLKKFKNKDKK